ncbi:hypothetical protein BC835DRAFT_1308132 [Cytidiella melzeri]|nr:hypothetical protein BC835DRAFT_1308132 [Cytidiella melzeri]
MSRSNRSAPLFKPATVLVFITLVVAIFKNATFKIYTGLLTSLSMITVLAVFAVNIAYATRLLQDLNNKTSSSLGGSASFGLGLWLMLIPAIFVVAAFIVVCAGWWLERRGKYVEVYPMSPTAVKKSDLDPWWQRFKWASASKVGVDRQAEGSA